ncbi:hypothetical protein [Cesiribacter sp. SM1]|uniref:hypothetical protein n=1 Tax=Cesiribacter sp. SM1 TaxID=2861196 RepID=UPI0021060872|nr:hypothetical protein [Cesiribacter sp. SM1]
MKESIVGDYSMVLSAGALAQKKVDACGELKRQKGVQKILGEKKTGLLCPVSELCLYFFYVDCAAAATAPGTGRPLTRLKVAVEELTNVAQCNNKK